MPSRPGWRISEGLRRTLARRGLHGVYHHASPKHLHRYVGEFAFRLGDGDVKNHTLDRLDKLFAAAVGQRLTYKELIA